LLHQTVIGQEALVQMEQAEAIPQLECFQAALMFARTQGIVPAPEPTHAIAAAIREANRCKDSGESRTILTALCGHGHLDMSAYEAYLHGAMKDLDFPEDELRAAMEAVPVV
ncbi:MAG TPA: TrpB-like pyridoxal-phosphate dependent enzyme, partial [Myxococcaceae bacterium]